MFTHNNDSVVQENVPKVPTDAGLRLKVQHVLQGDQGRL